jgi:hypothetical protein
MQNCCPSRTVRCPRRGTAAVAFALVAPLFFTFLLAFFELGHGLMVDSVLENAAYEGARQGILPGANADQVRAAAKKIAATCTLKNIQVTIDPPVLEPFTRELTVTASVQLSEAGLLVGKYLRGQEISHSVTMACEPRLRFMFPPEVIDEFNPVRPKPRGRGRNGS